MIKTLVAMVAGVTFEDRQTILATLNGDEPCRLEPEPDNPYDKNAIKVLVATADGVQHVGYVPKGIAYAVSQGLDGESAMCKLLGVVGNNPEYPDSYLGLRIEIELQLPDPPVPLRTGSARDISRAFDDDDGSDAYFYGGKW